MKKPKCIYYSDMKHLCFFVLLALAFAITPSDSHAAPDPKPIANTIAAQPIKGKVFDAEGEPLIGATIRVKGSNKGTISDHDGTFSIEASPGSILLVSYLGMKPMEVKVKGDNMEIKLKEDTQILDEVVAVGYGTMKRSDLTGSVVSIGSDAIERNIVTSIDQILQGQAAGLQLMQNSGIPGGSSSIQIRGVSSINNTNEPIYVIDGVIIDGATGSTTSNAIANLNQADVESIEILKDASATAIYGAQGANGVILVTMKKGKQGKSTVSFNAYYGVQQLSKEIDVMNLSEYAQFYMEQYAVGLQQYNKPQFANPAMLGRGTNWQKAIFRDAMISNYNLSLRGGTKDYNYSISAGYLTQDGTAVGSSFDRFTLRLNAESQIYKWLKIGSTINLSATDQETSMANWSLIPNALYQVPHIPVYNPDGSFGGPTDEQDERLSDYSNPVAVASFTERNNKKYGARGNISATIKPVKWLSFRTELSADGNLDNYNYFLPEYKIGYSVNSIVQNEHSKRWSLYWAFKNVLTADYTFVKKHKVSAMLGQEISSRTSDYLQGKRLYGSSQLTGLDAGDPNYSTNVGNSSERNFSSIFGRLHYGYSNRYLFTFTLRRDGSSNFAEDQRWGVFPSYAAAWKISDEPFLKKVEWLDNFKIRVGYGEVGNSNCSAFAYDSMLTSVQSNFGIAYQTANIPNKNLTWETTKSWNVGIDLNFLGNRIEFIADTYIKKTDDLLMQLALPGYLGTSGTGSASSQWANVGKLENKGVEFTLNTVNVSNRNFMWRTGITFSLNKNEIISMNTENGYIDKTYDLSGSKSVVTRTATGHPVSQFYGHKVLKRIETASDFLIDNGDGTSTVIAATPTWQKGYTGAHSEFTNAYTSVGDWLYEDINKDGTIDERDRDFIGNPLPKFTYGITNSFTYKDFDLSIFLYGSQGNKVFNWLNRRLENPNFSGNHTARTLDYPKIGYLDGESTNANVWNLYVLPGSESGIARMSRTDPNDNDRVSDNYVEDAGYLRIQNITFGYTLPKKLMRKMKINKLRFYASIQNLYTFTDYSGYDPEVGSTQGQYSYSGQSMLMYGVDTGRYPSPRTYTIGLDLNF